MTKKDYEMVAKAIRETDCKEALVNELCRAFSLDNPNFDKYKFRLACEKYTGPKPTISNIAVDFGL